jgi:hypothetical protein
MTAQINLLPKDDLGNLRDSALARGLRRVSYLSLGFFLFFSVGSFLLLYYLGDGLKKAQIANSALRSEVRSLEATEQGLVLLKDRLGKISDILSLRDTNDAVEKQEKLLGTLGVTYSLRELKLSSDSPFVTIHAPDSLSMRDLFLSLYKSPDYENVRLVNLIYGSDGYMVSLVVN